MERDSAGWMDGWLEWERKAEMVRETARDREGAVGEENVG